MSETNQNMTDKRIERSDVVPIVSRSADNHSAASIIRHYDNFGIEAALREIFGSDYTKELGDWFQSDILLEISVKRAATTATTQCVHGELLAGLCNACADNYGVNRRLINVAV